jgi:hypothetical protein
VLPHRPEDKVRAKHYFGSGENFYLLKGVVYEKANQKT